jgi:cell division septal protein FtsQ
MGEAHTHPGVEPEDINTGTLFRVIGVSAIVVAILVVIGFNLSMQKFKEVQLEVTELTGYPELHETEMMGASKLSGYEAQADGSYRIPIERAMELEARNAQ